MTDDGSLLVPDDAVASRCRNCEAEMKPILSLGACPNCGGGVVAINDDGEELL